MSSFERPRQLLGRAGVFAVTDNPDLYVYAEECVEVTLEKSDLGVGFSLGGGADSPHGSVHIVIKKIFYGEQLGRESWQ